MIAVNQTLPRLSPYAFTAQRIPQHIHLKTGSQCHYFTRSGLRRTVDKALPATSHQDINCYAVLDETSKAYLISPKCEFINPHN